MRRILSGILIAVILLNQPAIAAVKKFKNCAELNKIYPAGVSKRVPFSMSGTDKNETKFNPVLYKANIKLDLDRDGIACEKK